MVLFGGHHQIGLLAWRNGVAGSSFVDGGLRAERRFASAYSKFQMFDFVSELLVGGAQVVKGSFVLDSVLFPSEVVSDGVGVFCVLLEAFWLNRT